MVLVSLVGDFDSSTLPIFFEFKDELKKHIIISDKSKGDSYKLKKIIRGQKRFKKRYNLDYEVLEIRIDEDDLADISSCYDTISSYTPVLSDLYFNGTDGLSSTIVILASKILKNGGNFISYDKHDNEYILLTKDTMKKVPITNFIDIKNHILLKGSKIESFTPLSDLIKRKDTIFALMQDPLRYKEFTNLLQNTSIDKINGYDDFKKLAKKIDKFEDRLFLQGGVFEEYIYWLIESLGFDDVMAGVEVRFEDSFKNEFDILMIKDNHLHAIECKFVNALNGTHYIYKINSLIDYLDDDGKAMVLSVGGKNRQVSKKGRVKVQFTQSDRSRAYYGNIDVFQTHAFDEDEFLKRVKAFFID